MFGIAVGVATFAFSSLACAHQQPLAFTVGQRSDTMAVVGSTLAGEGLTTAAVDRRKGTITTQWFDTGYRFRDVSAIDDVVGPRGETDVFLRYRISVNEEAGQQIVTVEPEVQRCEPQDAVITSDGVRGTCLPMSEPLSPQRKQAEQLMSKLRTALSAS